MNTTAPTAAELAILRVLWRGGPATVRQVHEAVYGGSDTGYTGALKLMQNMLAKGLVTRAAEGRGHVYAAAVAERPTLNRLVSSWIDNAFAGSSLALAMQALDARPAAPEELARLKALIQALEGGEGDGVSGFTAAYLARAEIWMLLAAVAQAVLADWSWRGWSAALAGLSAQARYRLAAAHFASLLILPAITAVVLHGAAVHLRTATMTTGAPEAPAIAVAAYAALVRAAPAVALVWAAGAGVMMAALLAQAWRTMHIGRGAALDAVQQQVDRLAWGWAGLRPPRAIAGAHASPHVMGVLRPVLVCAPGFAQGLTLREQEAVLLHELAHVWRRDFAWNLLCRAVLALLWFQPAAWRLYREVGREREACCDALAVARGAEPTALARALLRLAEAPAASLPMAIARGGELSVRVQRLLAANRPAAHPRVARLVAASGLTFALLAAVGLGRLATVDPALGDLSRASVLGPTISIAGRDPRGPFQVSIRRGRVVAAAIGAHRLPPDGIVQRGPRVTLLEPGRHEPLLSLHVTPGGRISWKPRA